MYLGATRHGRYQALPNCCTGGTLKTTGRMWVPMLWWWYVNFTCRWWNRVSSRLVSACKWRSANASQFMVVTYLSQWRWQTNPFTDRRVHHSRNNFPESDIHWCQGPNMQKVTRCNGTVAGLDVVDAMLFYPSEVRFPLIHQCLLITPAKAFRKGKNSPTWGIRNVMVETLQSRGLDQYGTFSKLRFSGVWKENLTGSGKHTARRNSTFLQFTPASWKFTEYSWWARTSWILVENPHSLHWSRAWLANNLDLTEPSTPRWDLKCRHGLTAQVMWQSSHHSSV